MERTPPFTDPDLRLIVTQALKTTTIPLQRLVQLFDEYNAQPAWEDMELPYRRTLQECKDAFESLRPGQPSPYARQDTPSNPNKRKSGLSPLESAPGSSGGSAPKRRQSTIIGQEKGALHILPKPPSTGSSPSVATFPPVLPTKRRGRPPKAVVEQRHQEQIRRGEVLAPGPMPLTPGPIHFSSESQNPPGYAPIAPRSGMQSPALPSEERRPGNVPEASTAPKRPRSSPKNPKKETHLGPGETMFQANPQMGTPETRETFQSAPRETVQAGPTTSRVESAPAAQSASPAVPEAPPRPLAESAPPRPPPDP